MASCRDCKLYDLDAVKDRAGRVRRDRAAQCLWRPESIVLPDSVKLLAPVITKMQPDDGQRCKRFIKKAIP